MNPLNATNNTRIITHGRDTHLYIWKIPLDDLGNLSTTLPLDIQANNQSQQPPPPAPWLVESMRVNTLNFCSFAMCSVLEPGVVSEEKSEGFNYRPILVAVPSALDSNAIDIFRFPSSARVYSSIRSTNNDGSAPTARAGMAMALSLSHTSSGSTILAAGYENGSVAAYRLLDSTTPGQHRWESIYNVKIHIQPVLSLTTAFLSSADDGLCFLSTSADSLIVRHAPLDGDGGAHTTIDTRHLGLQGVSVRSDNKIFAVAGWDGRFRVFSVKTMKALAVLKWHVEGCYTTAFAMILDEQRNNLGESPPMGEESLVSAQGTISQFVEDRAGLAVNRVIRECTRHWLAGGSKDGKVSLWEIY